MPIIRRTRCPPSGVAIVTITRLVKRGCLCVKRVRRVRVICRCPVGGRRVVRCLPKGRLVILYYYKRIRCRSFLKCRCVTLVKRYVRMISCSLPRYVVTKCRGGYRRVHAIFSLLRRCRCIKVRRTRNVRCKKCQNLLVLRDCAKLERTGMCERSSFVRNLLCKKRCGTCRPCKGLIRYIRRPGRGLKTDKRYGKRFLIRKVTVTTLGACVALCNRYKNCRSFEMRNGRVGFRYLCVLSTVTTRMLRRRVRKYKGNRAPKRTLFIKICAKRCKKPRTKKVGSCRCAGRRVRICWGVYRTTYYVRTRTWRCRRRVRIHKSPCGRPCINIWPPKVCRKMKRRGLCRRRHVRRLCNKSCMKGCPCNRRLRIVTRCRRVRGKLMYTVIQIIFRKIRGICTLMIRRKLVKCRRVPCIPGVIKKVAPCIGGKRTVWTIRVSRDLSKPGHVLCKRKITRRVMSCRGCCPSVTTVVTPCRRGRRLVSVIWWARIRGCCRRQSFRIRHSCRGCPADRIRYSLCHMGVRVRYRLWYHRRLSRGGCHKHIKVSLKRCWWRRKKKPKKVVVKPKKVVVKPKKVVVKPKKKKPVKKTKKVVKPKKKKPAKKTKTTKKKKKPYYAKALSGMKKLFG